MVAAREICVDVVYIVPDQQFVKSCPVEAGMTVSQVIRQSGVMQAHPEIDLNQNKVGIFSQLCDLETVVTDGDRIEIYRSLQADPKEARRRRANKH